MNEPILVSVRYHIQPGKRAEFCGLLEEAGVAEASRREKGNLRYELSLPLDDENALCLFEIWAGEEARRFHAATEHYRKLTELKKRYVLKVELRRYAGAELPAEDVELRKVDEDNVWALVKLSVKPEQSNFVATNANSLIEAYVANAAGEVALPFGIYHKGEPVGFVMFGYSASEEEGLPKAAKGSYCLWRFMIDQAHQRQGIGRKALKLALGYLETYPCGYAERCWLSYEPENEVAKALYRSVGFEENGEKCENEIVAVRKL